MKYLLCWGILLCTVPIFAQQKPLAIADIHRWKRIEQPRPSNDGQWVAYALVPHTEGDAQVALWHAATGQTRTFARANEPRFTQDNRFLVFRVRPPLDTLKAQRRRKVKDEDLPKDTLYILDLQQNKIQRHARVKTFWVPEKWDGHVLWQGEIEKPAIAKKDTSAAGKAAAEAAKKWKKETKESGSKLYSLHLASGRCDTFPFVTQVALAKKAPAVVFTTTGKGLNPNIKTAAAQEGVYYWQPERRTVHPLWRQRSKYAQITVDEIGQQVAFVADLDTSKARIRPWKLLYWSAAGPDSARMVARPADAFLKQTKETYQISEHQRPMFSEDGSKLYFGTAPLPVLNDTTLLPEEIVQVEVWSWTQNRLYTEQNNRLEAEKKRAFPAVFHTRTGRTLALGNADLSEWRFQESRNADGALAFTEEPYTQMSQWEGTPHKDLYWVNLQTGERTLIGKDVRVNPHLSPNAQYVVWWSDPDSSWFSWSNATRRTVRLTTNRTVRFFDEEADVPDFPNEYGIAGWLEQDARVVLYDRYDLWLADPSGQQPLQRITNGRPSRIISRYLRLQPEERHLPTNQSWLLHQVNETTKAEGYIWLDPKTYASTPWLSGDFRYGRAPQRARDADMILFTKENLALYPNLRIAKPNSPTETVVSNANPQQAEYAWPTVERVMWTSLTGEPLEGMLFKPTDFDRTKKYPLLVYFYERMSDELHTHRAPDAGRSSINFTMYASRGYLVFVPDIPYKTGYPGESAYDAVMSGLTMLLNQGFVDKARLGMQGHSWGGYQSAYIATRTNMFTCIESGAAVVNMTSAYGGIRWESGRSRQFQYERSQSRIGGTLWQYPMRYLENSPLFALDKVQTPILILHNDKDGAVPWYQGIEFFTGLKRLGKPVWLLNYNDEPHWPVKLQNRIDFQTRMQQFFDYYLMGAPKPRWMERGVPAMEKGILQGLEPTNR